MLFKAIVRKSYFFLSILPGVIERHDKKRRGVRGIRDCDIVNVNSTKKCFYRNH